MPRRWASRRTAMFCTHASLGCRPASPAYPRTCRRRRARRRSGGRWPARSRTSPARPLSRRRTGRPRSAAPRRCATSGIARSASRQHRLAGGRLRPRRGGAGRAGSAARRAPCRRTRSAASAANARRLRVARLVAHRQAEDVARSAARRRRPRPSRRSPRSTAGRRGDVAGRAAARRRVVDAPSRPPGVARRWRPARSRRARPRASSEHTPYVGMPSAWPMLAAVTRPTRRPVNGPGPRPATIAPGRAGRRRPVRAPPRSRAPAARRARGRRPCGSAPRISSPPCHATAAVTAGVEVSRISDQHGSDPIRRSGQPARSDQSTGVRPASARALLAALNGRQPRKPSGLSGLGCPASSTTCAGLVTRRRLLRAYPPQSRKTIRSSRAFSARIVASVNASQPLPACDAGRALADRQHRVEQQHALRRPAGEVTGSPARATPRSAASSLNTLRSDGGMRTPATDAEAQPVRLAGTVVRVLAEDQHPRHASGGQSRYAANRSSSGG